MILWNQYTNPFHIYKETLIAVKKNQTFKSLRGAYLSSNAFIDLNIFINGYEFPTMEYWKMIQFMLSKFNDSVENIFINI